MTLRLRLLLLLVGIVATGLVVSDVVTYTGLNRFLVDRVDQQLAAATFPVERALTDSSTGAQGGFFPLPGFGTTQPATSVTPTAPATPGTIPSGPGNPDDRRSLARGQLVPPGTFGELLSPDGKIVSHQFFTYGGTAPTSPKMPARLPSANGRGVGRRPTATCTSPSRARGPPASPTGPSPARYRPGVPCSWPYH